MYYRLHTALALSGVRSIDAEPRCETNLYHAPPWGMVIVMHCTTIKFFSVAVVLWLYSNNNVQPLKFFSPHIHYAHLDHCKKLPKSEFVGDHFGICSIKIDQIFPELSMLKFSDQKNCYTNVWK